MTFVTHTSITAWIKGVQAHIDAHRPDSQIEQDVGGKKYLRIVETSKSPLSRNRSVFCFIEIATGNIYKADGWSRPAKGVRGNIADANFSIGRGVTAYGGAYAR
jgi:hypothetical protein